MTFLGTKSKVESGPISYTSVRGKAPKGSTPRFNSINDAGASEALLCLAVPFYQDLLRYDGDIVIALHEARGRDPLAKIIRHSKVGGSLHSDDTEIALAFIHPTVGSRHRKRDDVPTAHRSREMRFHKHD